MIRDTASTLGCLVKGGTIALVISACTCLPTSTHAADFDYYEQLILRSVAPYDPWTVKTNDKTITVRKTDKVKAVLKSDPKSAPLEVNYTLRITFSDRIPMTDYKKQMKVNENAQRAIDELQKDLDQISHVGRKYKPRGAAQTAIVDKYNKLRWAIKPLPEAYDSKFSVVVDSGPYTVIGKHADECEAVLRAINSPFSPYPKPTAEEKAANLAAANAIDLRTALANTKLQTVRYKEARLSNVLNLLNRQLEIAMNQRISPVIVTTRLSAEKLATPVTLVSATPLPLADVLSSICQMYNIHPQANLKTNQIYLSEKVKTAPAPKPAPTKKAAPAQPAPEPERPASRLRTSDGKEVKRIGD